METPFLIAGWKEWVTLPDLQLHAIKAKLDTGAATSSLHAYDIEYLKVDGISYVRYNLHPIQKSRKITRSCCSVLIDKRRVRSSSGILSIRPVIQTQLKIGNFTWEIELNLTNRDSMGMRMLLGREALCGKILVNPAHKFLHGKLNNKKLKELYR